eukprot:11231699-Karenia_brevis.AAC.1
MKRAKQKAHKDRWEEQHSKRFSTSTGSPPAAPTREALQEKVSASSTIEFAATPTTHTLSSDNKHGDEATTLAKYCAAPMVFASTCLMLRGMFNGVGVHGHFTTVDWPWLREFW